MVRLVKDENDLATVNPMLAKEWHPTKNENLNPEDITSGSSKEVWWLCPKGHSYSMVVNQRTKRGYGCPYCSGHRVLKGISDLATTNPDLAKEWNYDKNIDLTPCDVTAGSRKKVWWLCEKGHAYEQLIIKRTNRGYSCPYCSGHKALRGFNDLATVNPRLAKEWHPTKNADLTPFDVTAGSGKRVWWVCPVGHEYQATIHDRNSDDTQCPICNAKNQTSFPEQAILYYVKKLYPDTVNRYREIFEHSMELDVYIPSIRLGIEFDGAAWHNSATQLKREKKKYTICQKHHITLIRIKENTDQEWNDVADAVYYIPKVRTYSALEGVIQAILDSIDQNSNMWTRKNPYYLHSAVTVDLERDRADILNYLNEIKNSLADLRPDLTVGLLHLFDTPHPGLSQLIRVNLYVGGQDIPHEVLIHRQLEQQVSHPFTECIQLAFQHIGENPGQVSIGRFCVQVTGVETDGLFDKFISGGAVISPVARFHLGPGGFTEPDGMFLIFLFQIQNPLLIASAPPESLSQRGFRRLLRKNSANLKSG